MPVFRASSRLGLWPDRFGTLELDRVADLEETSESPRALP